MNISTSRTLPPSCMYCLGELSRMVGTPANMLLPSDRDSAKSSSKPPPRARFLRDRNAGLVARAQQAPQRHQTGQGGLSQREATGPQMRVPPTQATRD